MAATRQHQPRKYGATVSFTRKLRARCGKKYAPTVLARYVAVNTSDCARKNPSITSCVWKLMGRKGNVPPHTLAALMARNSA